MTGDKPGKKRGKEREEAASVTCASFRAVTCPLRRPLPLPLLGSVGEDDLLKREERPLAASSSTSPAKCRGGCESFCSSVPTEK